MKIIRQVLLIAAILLIGLAGAGYLIKTRQKPAPVPVKRLPPVVRVQAAQPRTVHFAVASQGTVSPRTEITLVAEVTGRIVAVSPSLVAGGFFAAEELLVQVDSKDYELAVVRAEANVMAAQARIVREEAEAAVARQEWRELNGEQPLPPLLAREPQLAEAKAALASAQATVEEAKRELDKTKLAAPFTGRVISKSADVGQYVTRGNTLARLQAVDYAEVRLPIPVEQMSYVNLPVNAPAEARSASGPLVQLRGQFAGLEHVWTGVVTRTESQIDPQTRMVTAVARVNDPYRRAAGAPPGPPLPAGLFVTAEIAGHEGRDLYEIPRIALRGDNLILLVKPLPQEPGLGELEIRTVPVVRAQREVVYVRGLQPGEMICLSPLDAPVDGMRVRIAESAPAGAPKATP